MIKKYSRILAVLVFFCCLLVFFCSCDENNTQDDIFTYPDQADVSGLVNQANNIIFAVLQNPNPQYKPAAIEVAGETRRAEFMPIIERLVTDNYIPVRFAAAIALADNNCRTARQNILLLLKDKDPNPRLAAAYALYKFGDKSKFDMLLEGLKSTDMVLRSNAAYLLGKTGNTKAIKPLWDALRASGSSDGVKIQSIEALARLKDEKVYPKIWAMLINTNSDDKVYGVEAMGYFGTEKARGAIISVLSDPIPEIRLAAARQLGKLGDPSAEKEVLDIINDDIAGKMTTNDAERINILTALAIGEIKSSSLTAFLPKLLNDRSVIVRIATAKAVFQCDKVR